MATLLELETAILDISKNHYIQTDSSITLVSRINAAVTDIACGIRLPNGQKSFPLPELYLSAVIATDINVAYKALPDTYQRDIFYVSDKNNEKVSSPGWHTYYSFKLFLEEIKEKDLSESGDIYIACVMGKKLYYQAIPAVSENLTIHFYRKPIDMALDTDTPDGIPEHLQVRLIENKVGYALANTMVDGLTEKAAYHEAEFYKAMQDLEDYTEETDPVSLT